MLYHLLYSLHTVPALRFLNVVRYVSTRSILAILTALLLGLLLGPWLIARLKRMQIGENIRHDGPEAHKKKAGTPTMGGLLILFCVTFATLCWCDLTNRFVWIALFVTLSFGAVGFLDDYRKLKVSKKGLPGKLKIGLQTILTLGVVAYVFGSNLYDPSLRFRIALPLLDFNKWAFELLPVVYFGLAMCVILGASHAVNLTDGLDGLAIGPVIVAAGTFLVLSYGTGSIIRGFNIAEYLKIPYIPGSGELAVFCGALTGAGVGFLWYNTYPAQVFMGDVGSLSIGGALGVLAVLTKNDFTLVILGGVFVAETLSVIAQVLSFKLTGKRIFKMAPLHHHFELGGLAEPKVVVRAWIISIALALVSLALLKVR
jgi:phospho-N-acetylmuramoyl-pentapeptide-transferase